MNSHVVYPDQLFGTAFLDISETHRCPWTHFGALSKHALLFCTLLITFRRFSGLEPLWLHELYKFSVIVTVCRPMVNLTISDGVLPPKNDFDISRLWLELWPFNLRHAARRLRDHRGTFWSLTEINRTMLADACTEWRTETQPKTVPAAPSRL